MLWTCPSSGNGILRYTVTEKRKAKRRGGEALMGN
jgi:hypothetical protein